MRNKSGGRRALVIINLESGGGQGRKKLGTLLEELSRGSLRPDVHITRGPRDAVDAAREAAGEYDLVVAAGGDGTINEVINGAAESGLALGIAPLGTENVLAREFRIPESPRDAARVVLDNHQRTIDLGKANGRYFALMAGIGFDAYVASRVSPVLKKLFGSAAYVTAALEQAFSYDPQPITVTVDGEEIAEGYFVVVGNARYYTRFFELTPHADLCDGLLDVVVFKNKELLHLFKYFVGASVRQLDQMPDVEIRQGRHIGLTAPAEVLAHVDCEILGTTPIEITVAPSALNLLVPRPRRG